MKIYTGIMIAVMVILGTIIVLSFVLDSNEPELPCEIDMDLVEVNDTLLNSIVSNPNNQFLDIDFVAPWIIDFKCNVDQLSITEETLFISTRRNGLEEDKAVIEFEWLNETTLKLYPVHTYLSGFEYKLTFDEALLGERVDLTFTVKERSNIPNFDNTNDIRLQYNFNDGLQGFTGKFMEIFYQNEDTETFYQLEFKHAELPIGENQYGLYMQSYNASDDVFMFIMRMIGIEEGLLPNTTYHVNLDFEILTQFAPELFGVGGAPGEHNFVKAGAVNREIKTLFDEELLYTYPNFFKSNQISGDVDGAVIGNLAKLHSTDDSWEAKPFNHSFEVTTNALGQVWIFMGNDSGFEGLTRIYFTNITIEFIKLT